MNPNQQNPDEQPQQNTNPFTPAPEHNPAVPQQPVSPAPQSPPETTIAPTFQQPLPEATTTPPPEQPSPPVTKKSPAKKWIITILSIIGLVIISTIFRYIGGQVGSNVATSTTSNADYIKKVVATTKESTTLPVKVDRLTTWQDIKATDTAVVYSYLLTDVDPSELSSANLRTSILSGLCKNADTKAILDRGILMDYDYRVQDHTETYYISISKADCS